MQAIESFGGGVGIGAIITALVGLIGLFPKLKRTEHAATRAATELSPNHGTSMKDQLARMEIMLDSTDRMLRSQGQQIGEIRSDALQTHQMLHDSIERINRRIDDLT